MTGALNDLLKATSRSFYLTLRVLPRAVRPQIGLAFSPLVFLPKAFNFQP
jgi:phytoene/squalene synthetase